MKKHGTYRMKRIISGYRCRLWYEHEYECYLITADRFPGLVEDGRNKREATFHMKMAIHSAIKKLKDNGKTVPPVDDTEWKNTVVPCKEHRERT